MKERININKAEPAIYKAIAVAEDAVKSFDLDAKLKELIRIRVSQVKPHSLPMKNRPCFG